VIGLRYARKAQEVIAVQVGDTTTMTGHDGLPLTITTGQYLVWDQVAPHANNPRVVSAYVFEADYVVVSREPVQTPSGGHV